MRNYTPLLFLIFFAACKPDDNTPEPVTETVADFDKNFGSLGEDRGFCALITPLNHILIGGSFQTSTNYTDFYLVELDINGEFIREKTYGNDLDDVATAIAKADGENHLIGGTTTTGLGSKDILLIKINAEGEKVWEKTYGGGNNEDLAFILPVDNTGYMLGGFTESFGAGARDAFLIKIDLDGNEIWSKTYGGINRDGANDMLATGDGNFMLFGYTESYGAGDRDYYLLKLNAQGDTIWTKTYGSPNYEETYQLVKIQSGGYLMSGHSAAFDLNHDMYGVRINDDGDEQWGELYGGTAHDGSYSALQNSAGDFIMLGESQSFGNGNQCYLVKIDQAGGLVSESNFGSASDEAGFKLLETPLSYIMIGETNAPGNYQVLVKKVAK